MVVCFFGNYIFDYPRVQVMRKGLRQNGVEVVECHTRERGLRKYVELWKAHRQVKGQYEVLVVCMGGQTLVWFARLLTRKKVVLDAFVSAYITNVEDRHTVRRRSLKALLYWLVDALSCLLADHVLLDTEAQIEYFVKHFRLPRGKFSRILVGADDEIYFPSVLSTVSSPNKFIVHWHGHLVPFHGVEYILEAAARLRAYQEIEFRLVTRFTHSYTRLKARAEVMQLHNVHFFPETDFQGVAQRIREADVCLGVFGDNPKTHVVIPNKIVEAIACGKPVITARSRALKELFVEGEQVIVLPPADGRALADAIVQLKEDQDLRTRIGKNAYALYQRYLTPFAIGREVARMLGQL